MATKYITFLRHWKTKIMGDFSPFTFEFAFLPWSPHTNMPTSVPCSVFETLRSEARVMEGLRSLQIETHFIHDILKLNVQPSDSDYAVDIRNPAINVRNLLNASCQRNTFALDKVHNFIHWYSSRLGWLMNSCLTHTWTAVVCGSAKLLSF